MRPAEPTGVLVARVWIERADGGGFRARITRTLDVSARDETVAVAASPEEVARAVAEWLDAFLLAAAEVTER